MYFDIAKRVCEEYNETLVQKANRYKREDEIDQLIRCATLVLTAVVPKTDFERICLDKLAEAITHVE